LDEAVRIVFVVLVFLMGQLAMSLSPVIASTPPPQDPTHFGYKGGTLKSSTVGVSMGAQHIVFEQTPLDIILENTLTGEISHRGDAGASMYWLCFTAARLGRTERIWVMSDGEMGGPDHVVTELIAKLVPTTGVTKDCPLLPNKFRSMSLDTGIWLGISDSKLSQLLGGDRLNSHSWGLWDYEGKVPSDKCAGGFDRKTSLLVQLTDGYVSTIHVSQVTSC
jgi:hypothetical protein